MTKIDMVYLVITVVLVGVGTFFTGYQAGISQGWEESQALRINELSTLNNACNSGYELLASELMKPCNCTCEKIDDMNLSISCRDARGIYPK